ncbi:MAG: hypothetical protein QHJ73_07095, partial [Armatimonadota bacterium]|nr:hypothetical protein [Armatimonadota bacterium]
WLDPSDDPRRGAMEYQAELVRQVVETARRLRTRNTGVAGVMPFTYFFGWSKARRVEDLVVKPAFEALRVAYQPVLLSPECWRRHVYPGGTLALRLCVLNDDDAGRDLAPTRARLDLTDATGRVVKTHTVPFPPVSYYGSAWSGATIPLPANLPEGDYTLRCTLTEGERLVSRHAFDVKVAPKSRVKRQEASLFLYDPSGTTGRALAALGATRTRRLSRLDTFPAGGVVVLGEGALGEGRFPPRAATLAFLERGGRILCLRQGAAGWQSDWLPARWNVSSRALTYVHPVGASEAIFGGIRPRDLRTWNELGRDPNGVPDVCPVVGALRPASGESLRTSRIWAVCDQMISSAALVEVIHGRGSVILSQFRCVERVAHDPIAARLLANLIDYANAGPPAGLVDLSRPVRWDLTAIRDGVFTSPLQGLLPWSPAYSHTGGSKGRVGEDQRIVGFTLVGEYRHNALGWIQLPAGAAEGWGVIRGTLSRPATRFVVRVRHPGDTPARLSLKVDGVVVGEAQEMAPGSEQELAWTMEHGAGPVELELRGDPRLVLLESRFE